MKKIICTLACIALLTGSTSRLQARATNGRMLAIAALTILATDGYKRGKESWGYRKAAATGANMKALIQWVKSKRPWREKLGDLKAHFGRNWVKYALFVTFVVTPLILKYYHDDAFLKRYKRNSTGKEKTSWGEFFRGEKYKNGEHLALFDGVSREGNGARLNYLAYPTSLPLTLVEKILRSPFLRLELEGNDDEEDDDDK